ncbi:MAG: NYN domain-containing protein [Patescibacteria group bacterium]
MIKHREQRVGVFVDVANMYHSAKNLYGAKVNFQEVLKTAIAGRRLVRAIAYVIRSESEEERGFFGALDSQGFEVKAKDLQVFAGGAKKADWDVGIAIDAIKLADKIDSVVLVSGDGDYVPLITYLKENKGCQVEVIAFGKTTSAKLMEASDDFIDLGKDLKKYLITSQKKLKLIPGIKRFTKI